MFNLEIESNAQRIDEQLQTLMDFPTYITRAVPSEPQEPPSTEKVSLVYDLRGVIIDNKLYFFSRWEHITNPYKRKLTWYKADFSKSPDVGPVEEGEVLSLARNYGPQGISTVYVRDELPEIIEKVLPPDYLRVRVSFYCADGRNLSKRTMRCSRRN